MSEYNINFSFRILKDSLEKSDSLFLVMYVISYFSLEKDRDMFIFEDFHYDIDSDNVDILEEIAIKKIINISKSGNWNQVKNLSYVIDTFNLLFAYESENFFSSIVLEYSSDDNLMKLIKTILSIEKIEDNLEFDWKMLNKCLKINSICENFETHKKDNSEFYRENKIFIDKFLLGYLEWFFLKIELC